MKDRLLKLITDGQEVHEPPPVPLTFMYVNKIVASKNRDLILGLLTDNSLTRDLAEPLYSRTWDSPDPYVRKDRGHERAFLRGKFAKGWSDPWWTDVYNRWLQEVGPKNRTFLAEELLTCSYLPSAIYEELGAKESVPETTATGHNFLKDWLEHPPAQAEITKRVLPKWPADISTELLQQIVGSSLKHSMAGRRQDPLKSLGPIEKASGYPSTQESRRWGELDHSNNLNFLCQGLDPEEVSLFIKMVAEKNPKAIKSWLNLENIDGAAFIRAAAAPLLLSPDRDIRVMTASFIGALGKTKTAPGAPSSFHP